ncbi:Laminin Domain II [Porites harrisoni]
MTTPLPTCPTPDDPAELEDVLGFGLDLNSHALYRIERKTTLFKLISSKTELKFSFRASNPNGIMLYTANEPSHTDFLECHLEESKVACSFNAGGGTLKLITTDATYSDGKWHTVWLSRQKVDGTLYVDGIEVDSGKASGSPTYINSLERFFLGGVPEEFDAKRVPAGSRNSFPGCITNVTVDDEKIDTPVTTLYKAQKCCRDSPESGVSFKNGGGFLKVGSSTTSPAPSTPSKTTKPPSTTEESTTLLPTTTSEPVTTSAPTTTSEPITTPPPTTTPEPTTTPPPTTTPDPTTTPPPTTTREPTTTPPPTTTLGPTTTPVPTTTSEPMTTPLPTCATPDDPAELEDVLGFGLDLNSHALYRIERKTTLFKLISSK